MWKLRITTKHQHVYSLLKLELLITMYIQVNNCFFMRLWIWISYNLSADQKAQKESAGQKPLLLSGAGWSDCSVSLLRQCLSELSRWDTNSGALSCNSLSNWHEKTKSPRKSLTQKHPKNFPAFLKSSNNIVFSTWIIQYSTDTFYIIKTSNQRLRSNLLDWKNQTSVSSKLPQNPKPNQRPWEIC